MITITRKFEFDAAHRVLGHEGKCRHLHGHRYVAEVTARASELDSLGRVIDFSVLKDRIGTWIDKHWDHNILLHCDDPLLNIWMHPSFTIMGAKAQERAEQSEQIFAGKEPYVFAVGNPTAENIAGLLYQVASLAMVPYNITVTHVRVFETPNCWADYCERSK